MKKQCQRIISAAVCAILVCSSMSAAYAAPVSVSQNDSTYQEQLQDTEETLQPVPEKKTQEIKASDLSKEMGDAPFFLQAETNGGGTLSFASQNMKVAEINESTGEVTLVGTGTADIVIRASATDEYEEASKTIRLTVKKGDSGLEIEKSSYTKPYKSKSFFLKASARCAMKFKSSNPKIAKVSSKGKVTVLKCGKTNITITAGDKNYRTVRKKVTVKVVPRKAKIISVSSFAPGQLTVSWKRQKEADGYVLEYTTDSHFKKYVQKRNIPKNESVSANLENLQAGKKYYVRVKAYKTISKKKAYGKASKAKCKKVKEAQPQTTAQPGKRSLLNLLLTAKIPLGHTMYVWGGGWNEEDTGAGIEAVTIGESPRWRTFYEKQDSSYNYQNTRYQIHDGLDCSGYVGFVVYNVMESVNGNAGYVEKAGGMAKSFSDKGFGSYTLYYSVTDWKPGDIMSMKGHVWISLGMCGDGSVLLLHASPPGVMLCGTSLSDGSRSQAIELAESYMSTYYPDWYRKFPDCARSASYLTDSSQMRWSLQMLSDEEGIQNMGAEEVLKRIFDTK